MNNDVIPKLLTEEKVLDTPIEALKVLAECSSDIVLDYVNEYIAKNSDTSVGKRIEEAYRSVNERIRYLQSDKLKEIADSLNNLTYADVNANIPIDTLKGYKYAIEEALQNDVTAVKSRSVTKDKYIECIERLTSMGEIDTWSNQERKNIFDIRNLIESNKRIFKTAPFKKPNNTVLARILYKREQMELILYGINFLLPKLEARTNAQIWRYL